MSSSGVGFMAPSVAEEREYTSDELLSQVVPQDVCQFGLIPEFVGRVPVICHTCELTTETLVSILTEPDDAIVSQYRDLFEYDGAELVFEDDALEEIARLALEHKTGARGLRSICEGVLGRAMFDLPSMEGVDKVVVTAAAVRGEGEIEYVPSEASDEAAADVDEAAAA